jgi:hypothetical protein
MGVIKIPFGANEQEQKRVAVRETGERAQTL